MEISKKLKSDIKYVLGQLKEEFTLSVKGKPVIYDLRTSVIGAGIPSSDQKRKIILKLEELKAIKILHEEGPNWHTNFKGAFELQIIQPKFNELCKEYNVVENAESDEAPDKDGRNPAKRPRPSNPKIHIQLLSEIYEDIREADPRSFFISVSEYVKYLDTHQDLAFLLDKIYEEKAKEYEKYLQYSKALETQVNDSYSKLKPKLSKVKVKTNWLNKALGEYQSYLDGSLWISYPSEYAHYDYVYEIVRALEDAGYNDLIKEFLDLDESGNVIGYKVAPVVVDYRNEKDYLKKREEISLWGAWAHLVRVYIAIEKERSTKETLKEGKNIVKQMDFNLVAGEMTNILLGSPNYIPVIFRVEKYRPYVKRVHRFIKTELLELIPAGPVSYSSGPFGLPIPRVEDNLTYKLINSPDLEDSMEELGQKNKEEAEIRKLTLLKLRKELSDETGTPEEKIVTEGFVECFEKDGKGHIRYHDGDESCLGSVKAIPYRGVSILCEFDVGAGRRIAHFFKALYGDKSKEKLKHCRSDHEKLVEMLRLLDYSFVKALQKGDKLLGKMRVNLDPKSDMIFLEKL